MKFKKMGAIFALTLLATSLIGGVIPSTKVMKVEASQNLTFTKFSELTKEDYCDSNLYWDWDDNQANANFFGITNYMDQNGLNKDGYALFYGADKYALYHAATGYEQQEYSATLQTGHSKQWIKDNWDSLNFTKAYIIANPYNFVITYEGCNLDPLPVRKGDIISRPEGTPEYSNPSYRDNYIFIDWYEDCEFITKYVFGTEATKNVTIYARFDWAYSIRYYVDGNYYDEEKCAGGSCLTKPKDPVQEGYHFDGWYTDEACTEAFDWTTPINGDITIYAKFSQIKTGNIAWIFSIIVLLAYVAYVIAYNYVLKKEEVFYLRKEEDKKGLLVCKNHNVISCAVTALDAIFVILFIVLSRNAVSIVFDVLGVIGLAFGIISFLTKDKVLKLIQKLIKR